MSSPLLVRLRLRRVVAGVAAAAVLSTGVALAQGNPFSDVPPNSWAYQAIKSLAAEGLIEGYPDGKFKGNRPLTRYEAAVLVNRAVDKIEARLSSVEGAEKVNADDIAKLKKLVADFGPELKAVQDHLATLDTKVDTLGKETAANTATLKRQQFHLYSYIRAPGVFRDSVSGFNAEGVALASGTSLKVGDSLGSPEGANSPNDLVSGQNTHGTGYELTRLIFSGSVDPRLSYAIRLENREYFENAAVPGGLSATAPAYCTNLTACPSNANYPANASFRLNYAYLQYLTPGGFQIQAGRMLPVESLSDLGGQILGLTYADYFNGAMLGYIRPGLLVQAGYGFGNPAASNGGGAVGLTQQQMWATAAYDFIPHHLNLGGAWVTELGNNQALWNAAAPIYANSGTPACPIGSVGGTCTGPVLNTATGAQITGLYQPTSTPITFGSIFGTYRFSENLHLQAEFGHRFGKDPFTGATWQQPNAIWALATIGNNEGLKGTSWGELGFIGSGFNGYSPEGIINGSTQLANLYINDPGGYQIWYAGLHHHIANNVDLGLIYLHFALLPGTDMPASSTACPGCYITADTKDAVFLQTLIGF
jgi:hypothetical protein